MTGFSKISRILLILALAAAMLFAACSKKGEAAPTNVPAVTEAPEVEYSIIKVACYWPEDADPDNCDYSLFIEKPEFSQAFTAGYALNRAVDDYIDKLTDRIESRYIPAAVSAKPYTYVTCRVERIDSYTNIIFTENEYYEVQPYSETYVLMLDDRGNELNLCDVFMNYHAENLVAEHIAQLIANDGRYYDADAAEIIGALDIAHGAKITPEGATVYIREGLLAPFEEGELSFEILFADIAPEFVGEDKALSFEEYRTLTEFLGLVCDSAIVRGDDIEDGVLTQYAATAFMALASERMGIVPQAGRIAVPETDFEQYFLGCFGTEFPGIDTEAHDIKQQNGNYMVLNKKPEYTYYVDMFSAESDGDSVLITGDITFGTFGYAFTTPVCHVTVTLVRNAESPYSFTLKTFDMNL
ncbi:MAG: hypothetical protein IJM20_02480 [Clostridia bacterium]|nr:hypothetical protein [Clostridia bacterium]